MSTVFFKINIAGKIDICKINPKNMITDKIIKIVKNGEKIIFPIKLNIENGIPHEEYIGIKAIETMF